MAFNLEAFAMGFAGGAARELTNKMKRDDYNEQMSKYQQQLEDKKKENWTYQQNELEKIKEREEKRKAEAAEKLRTEQAARKNSAIGLIFPDLAAEGKAALANTDMSIDKIAGMSQDFRYARRDDGTWSFIDKELYERMERIKKAEAFVAETETKPDGTLTSYGQTYLNFIKDGNTSKDFGQIYGSNIVNGDKVAVNRNDVAMYANLATERNQREQANLTRRRIRLQEKQAEEVIRNNMAKNALEKESITARLTIASDRVGLGRDQLRADIDKANNQLKFNYASLSQADKHHADQQESKLHALGLEVMKFNETVRSNMTREDLSERDLEQKWAMQDKEYELLVDKFDVMKEEVAQRIRASEHDMDYKTQSLAINRAQNAIERVKANAVHMKAVATVNKEAGKFLGSKDNMIDFAFKVYTKKYTSLYGETDVSFSEFLADPKGWKRELETMQATFGVDAQNANMQNKQFADMVNWVRIQSRDIEKNLSTDYSHEKRELVKEAYTKQYKDQPARLKWALEYIHAVSTNAELRAARKHNQQGEGRSSAPNPRLYQNDPNATTP